MIQEEPAAAYATPNLASFFKMSGHANFLTKLLKISLRNILLIEKYFYKIIFTTLSNIHNILATVLKHFQNYPSRNAVLVALFWPVVYSVKHWSRMKTLWIGHTKKDLYYFNLFFQKILFQWWVYLLMPHAQVQELREA